MGVDKNNKTKKRKSTFMEADYRNSLFSFRCFENVPLQKLILLPTYKGLYAFIY
jgi:hypothetical protein